MTVTTAAAFPFPEDGDRSRRLFPDRRWGERFAVTEPAEPMWSPTPMVGFRMWTVRPDGVYGAMGRRWGASTLTAECLERGSRDPAGAPHLASQGVCRAACGINAFGAPASLVASMAPLASPRMTAGTAWSLFGAVSLSGRVVEHEDGYRAQHARVIALVLPSPFEIRSTVDPVAIARLFSDEAPGAFDWEVQIPIDALDVIPATVIDHLERTASHATRT